MLLNILALPAVPFALYKIFVLFTGPSFGSSAFIFDAAGFGSVIFLGVAIFALSSAYEKLANQFGHLSVDFDELRERSLALEQRLKEKENALNRVNRIFDRHKRKNNEGDCDHPWDE